MTTKDMHLTKSWTHLSSCEVISWKTWTRTTSGITNKKMCSNWTCLNRTDKPYIEYDKKDQKWSGILKNKRKTTRTHAHAIRTQPHIPHAHHQLNTSADQHPVWPIRLPPIIRLTALRRTLAAISAALATLFAHETTAQCRQASLPLAKVQPSSISRPLTKPPSILCPSSALVVVAPVGIVLAGGHSTSVVVGVERRIVWVGRSRRLGDRSCDGVSTCSLFDYVDVFCDCRGDWVCARICAIAPVLVDGRGKRTFVVGTEAEARLGSSLGSTC